MVTSPEMQVPEILDYDYIVSLWIGVNNYKLFTGFYKETEVWKKQPIWEQRNNDENGGGSNPDELSHSGPDRATQGQIEHIVGLCEAKGLDIKELILTATNDATDNPGMLTRVEASEIIETAKAY